jgi:hypothetical protein
LIDSTFFASVIMSSGDSTRWPLVSKLSIHTLLIAAYGAGAYCLIRK